MEFSDQQVMSDIISLLATQGWEKIVQDGISREFVDQIVAKFMISLEDAQADISKVKDEPPFAVCHYLPP